MRIQSILLLATLSAISALTKDEWRSRTIYQVVTDRFANSTDTLNYSDHTKLAPGVTGCTHLNNYCGGTFNGLRLNLGYIKNMGFDAILISPIVDNTKGSYHGYHARDWYKINPKFGTANDFRALLGECLRRGISVMLDVVANQVGPVGTDYSQINPFNKPEHYHDYCQITEEARRTDNRWVIENCRLKDLPDLNQENPWVQNALLDWVKKLLANYTIDGLHIESATEVPTWFWAKYREAAGVFTMGQVANNDSAYIRRYVGPLDSAVNYALFEPMRATFRGEMTFLQFREKIEQAFDAFGSDIYYMGLMVDNHASPRFLNTSKCKMCLRSAIVFTFFFPGIPMHYYGDEQLFSGGDEPGNQEPLWPHMWDGAVYQLVKLVNAVRRRNKVWEHPYVELYSAEHVLVFMRGRVIVALSNDQEKYTAITDLRVPMKEGTTLREVITRRVAKVGPKGKLELVLGQHDYKIFEVLDLEARETQKKREYEQ